MNHRRIPPLIDARAVQSLMNDPNVVLVDARGGPDAADRYAALHAEGAVRMDLETQLSKKTSDASNGGRHPLPDPHSFATTLGKAGISPLSHILVYDDKNGANAAARFWWMMRAAGHDKIQVIDGGLSALNQAGHKMVQGAEVPRAPVAPYPVSEWKLPTADIHTVDRARKDSDWLVIDVREAFRYRGESEPIDLVAGHIPGAVNVPYMENLSSDGRFLTSERLAQHYKMAIGNRRPENVIVHCGSGVTACHTLLAMDVAGIPTPNLYVGSWSEWSRNPKPVAPEKKPGQGGKV